MPSICVSLFMLTPEQETYILTHASVPEHTVVLMTNLSGGEPFLIDDYFYCHKDNWVIFIGYPLKHEFAFDKFEDVLEKVKNKFTVERLSIIAPKLPNRLGAHCQERESDTYYTLNIRNYVIGSAVKRNVRKASLMLTVERAAHMMDAHHELTEEFLDRVSPPMRVKQLFMKMPDYVSSANQAFVLNAWDSKHTLAAFYVVDFTARDFANYIIGCYSKSNYILGASDLLLSELIKMSIEYDKKYIHLGLGVNSGIRRFKEKWGAKPTISYEMCELMKEKSSILKFVQAIRKFKSQ